MKSILLKLIISLCIFFLCGAALFAQGQSGEKGQCKGKGIEKLKAELGLSEEQATQLKSFFERRREEKKAQLQGVELKIRSVLTPEQQKLWDGKKAEMKETGAPRENKGENKGGLKAMMEELNLTEDQRGEIRSIVQSEREKMHENRDAVDSELRSILTPEQMERFEAKRKELSGKRGKGHQGGKKTRSEESQ